MGSRGATVSVNGPHEIAGTDPDASTSTAWARGTNGCEHVGAVTVLTLRRPEQRNAIDRPTAEALAREMCAFEGDREVRVLW